VVERFIIIIPPTTRHVYYRSIVRIHVINSPPIWLIKQIARVPAGQPDRVARGMVRGGHSIGPDNVTQTASSSLRVAGQLRVSALLVPCFCPRAVTASEPSRPSQSRRHRSRRRWAIDPQPRPRPPYPYRNIDSSHILQRPSS
jgi:hypothetical protein